MVSYSGDFPKQAQWYIFDPTRSTILGTWNDVPIPAFRIGIDGIDSIDLALPRQFGFMDEPGEVGGLGTLAEGNYVECWVSSKTNIPNTSTLSLVGSAVVGSSYVGQGSNGGSLIWSGYIESHEPTPPNGVRVRITSLARVLEGSLIEGTITFTGDPLAFARQIAQIYCKGLSWDVRNPAVSGEYVTSVSITNTTVSDALRALREMCGPDWIVHVTAHGTIRFFKPDITQTATHMLQRVVEPHFTKDATTRVKRVVVVYGSNNPQLATAQASDFTTLNPRSTFLRLTPLTSAGDALRVAQLKLTELDRVSLRGTVTILDADYPIDTIEVGDTAQVTIDVPYVESQTVGIVGRAIVGNAYVGTSSYLGYDQPLIVVGIQYQFNQVTLELSKPQPDTIRFLARIERDLRNHLTIG